MSENKNRSCFALMDEMEKNENLKATDLLSRKQRMHSLLEGRMSARSMVAMTTLLLIGAISLCVGLFVPALLPIGLILTGVGIVEKIVSLFKKDERER